MPRILTLTPNPGLDVTVTVPEVQLDTVLRASATRVDPGGKGFNVARALSALGMESVALAPLGGHAGARMVEMLAAHRVAIQVVPIAQETRSCYVVTDAAGTRHLKVNEPGPMLTGAEGASLIAAVDAAAQAGDFWVLAGSLPPGLPADFFAQLIRLLQRRGAHAVLDASGEALRLGVAARPFMIKPNALEVADLLGSEVRTLAEAAQAARTLCAAGVEIVAISLGADGLLLAKDGVAVHAQPPAIQPRNTVGAGDASVAGILWALAQGLPPAEMARWGAACGTAATMRPGTDFAPLVEVQAIAAATAVEAIV